MIDGQGHIKQLRILGEGLKAEIGAAVLYELSGKSYLPLHDHRGNVVTLIDLKTTKPTEVYRYTAFGEKPTDDPLSPWRFASKRTDPETGFIFFGRRYYTPHLGRWITPDPQDFADGPNLYSYLKHCPMSDIDPYGLWSWKLWDKDLLGHPRVQGGLQAFGGLMEAGIGGGMTLGSGGMAAPLGWPIMAHGLDQFVTGMHKAVFGSYRETTTGQLLQKTGMPSHMAGLIDSSFSMSGGIGGAYLIQRGYAATLATLKIPNFITSNFQGIQRGQNFKPFIQVENSLKIGNFKYTNTAGKHINDVIKRGSFKGELARPYMKSPLTANEIMKAGKPIPDPGGIPGALRWDVPGTLRNSEGTWELVLHPEREIIYHFNFK